MLNEFESMSLRAGRQAQRTPSSKKKETGIEPSTNLSDAVRVSFFVNDRATQTSETELVLLNDATENLKMLTEELKIVHYDLGLVKNSFICKVEQDLEKKSLDIYALINQRLGEVTKAYDENLNLIRKAYNTKLINAIATVKRTFVEETNRNNAQNSKKLTQMESMTSNKEKNVSSQIQAAFAECEKKIKIAEQKAAETNQKLQLEHESKMNQLTDEVHAAKEQVNALNKKLSRLQDALVIKDEDNEKLMAEIGQLNSQLQKEQIRHEQVALEFRQFRAKAEHDLQKQAKESLAEAKRIKREKEQLEAAQQKQAAQAPKPKAEPEVVRKPKTPVEQPKPVEVTSKKNEAKALSKENRAVSQDEDSSVSPVRGHQSSKDLQLILRLKQNEIILKSEINNLNNLLLRNNQTWEKKFDILKNNLHSIKNEMYLRQSLQKQSVQVAYASLGYKVNDVTSFDQAEKPTALPETRAKTEKLVQPAGSLSSRKAENTQVDIPLVSEQPDILTNKEQAIVIPSSLSYYHDFEENQIVNDAEMDKYSDDLNVFTYEDQN